MSRFNLQDFLEDTDCSITFEPRFYTYNLTVKWRNCRCENNIDPNYGDRIIKLFDSVL